MACGCAILQPLSGEQDARVDEIRRRFSGVGFVMLGPVNPGTSDETRARVGWVAPYIRENTMTILSGVGHGWTPAEAAEGAWAQFEAEFGWPPGTSE